jgi:hypothetical protein
MNEEQKNALELLKQYCQEDENRLDFLETSIANRNIIVEDDGTIKYSSEYILGDKELQIKTMSVDYAYVDIKVGIINLINLNSDFKVKDGDVVVEKLCKFVVQNIVRSIKNNTTVEYWEKLNN